MSRLSPAVVVLASAVLGGCGGSEAAAPASAATLSISVNGSQTRSFAVGVGVQVQLTALIDGQPQASVAWRATGASATVDASGLLKGVTVGTVFVVANVQKDGRVVTDSTQVMVLGT
jgi:hypothetical protein